jgi:hypothetical protein
MNTSWFIKLKKANNEFLKEIIQPVDPYDRQHVFNVLPNFSMEMLENQSVCITDLHTGHVCDPEFEYSFGIIDRDGEKWIYTWFPLEKDDKSRGCDYIMGCKVENEDQVIHFLAEIIDVDPVEDPWEDDWTICSRPPLTQDIIDARIYSGPYPNGHSLAKLAGLTQNYK